MNRLLFVLAIAAALASACTARAPQEAIVYKPAPFAHQLRFPGETMALIAEWYTGSAANWKLIAGANPGVDYRRLPLGSTVLIPGHLVKRTTPLTGEAVQKYLARFTAAAAPTAAPARTITAPVPEPPAKDSVPAEQPPPAKAGAPAEQQPAAVLSDAELNQALYEAAIMNDLSTVEGLIAKGADLNAKSGERPLLIAVAQNGQLEMVKLLIRAGADLNAKDGSGQTALMRAAVMGHRDVVAALLNADADTDITDPQGRTARAFAEENGQTKIVELFWERELRE